MELFVKRKAADIAGGKEQGSPAAATAAVTAATAEDEQTFCDECRGSGQPCLECDCTEEFGRDYVKPVPAKVPAEVKAAVETLRKYCERRQEHVGARKDYLDASGGGRMYDSQRNYFREGGCEDLWCNNMRILPKEIWPIITDALHYQSSALRRCEGELKNVLSTCAFVDEGDGQFDALEDAIRFDREAGPFDGRMAGLVKGLQEVRKEVNEAIGFAK